jgi:DNA-binding MarR family transcriptional regulator
VPLGAALRQAWIGYQRLLEEQMAAAGVKRRDFPDGRVLHICARSSDTTISEIGRELAITRQGASKIVGRLRDQGFVKLQTSPDDGREKLVRLTRKATTYLEAQRNAARLIERRLKVELGEEAFDALYDLLELLGSNDTPRLRDFLRTHHAAMQIE